MFAFIGANLGRQFEFVQSEWMNEHRVLLFYISFCRVYSMSTADSKPILRLSYVRF
jgi:hypothetical protein